jgi:hypothetical protein
MEQVRFSSVEGIDSLGSPQKMNTVWRVTGKESGKDYGFVASSIYSKVKRNGDIQRTAMWGHAVLVEEFRSGVLFGYRSRVDAVKLLLRSQQ